MVVRAERDGVDRQAMDADPMAALQAFRRSIDNIDAALIHMLAERFPLHPGGRPAQGAIWHAARRSDA